MSSIMDWAQVPFPTQLPNADISAFDSSVEKEWKGDFGFIQAADTQFGLIADRYEQPKEEWEEEMKLTSQLIVTLNSMNPKPKFMVICGDMLNAFPKDQGELRERQYKDFIRIFKALDPEIKLVCVCGNHDMGDFPTPQTVQVYRKQFGKEYFHFWCGGVKFVVLNSQYFKAPDAVPEETLKHLQFVEEIADKDAKHIVTFQHIPFFLENPDEPDQYFNIDIEPRNELLNKLYDSGVRYVFCGHYHRNAGGRFKDMDQVVTSAVGCQLGNDKSGYRMVKVKKDVIEHEYIPIVL